MSLLSTDRKLLESFRRGEAAALERVYWEYVELVSAIVRRGFTLASSGAHVPGIGEPQAQCDFIQECFARCFSERARLAYDGLRPYRHYLLRVIKNLMIDRARLLGRELPASADISEESLGAIAASQDEDLDWARLQQATKEFVQSLEEPLRTLYFLRYDQGKAQVAVAHEMHLSRRRVRTLESDLRRLLHDNLQQLGLAELLEQV